MESGTVEINLAIKNVLCLYLNHLEFIGGHISTLVVNTFMFQLV